MEEEFRVINEFPDYEINRDGVVRRISDGFEPKIRIDNKTWVVTLYKNKKEYKRVVALLVAKTFLENPLNCKYILYKDEDVDNYRLENIEWSQIRQYLGKSIILNAEGRTCVRCGEFKLWDQFHNSKRDLYSKHHTCIQCVREKYQENQKEILKQKKKYYLLNKEEISRKGRIYSKENKEKISKYSKKYRDKLRDEINYNRKNLPTKYSLFKNKLTIFEDAREDDEGLLEVRCAHCRKYFYPSYNAAYDRVTG